MLTLAIIEIFAGSFCMQTEAIVVTFTLLEDDLMDNQQYYTFLLKDYVHVYKSIQHTNLSKVLPQSLMFS